MRERLYLRRLGTRVQVLCGYARRKRDNLLLQTERSHYSSLYRRGFMKRCKAAGIERPPARKERLRRQTGGTRQQFGSHTHSSKHLEISRHSCSGNPPRSALRTDLPLPPWYTLATHCYMSKTGALQARRNLGATSNMTSTPYACAKK